MRICDSHAHVGRFYDPICGKSMFYSPEELVTCMEGSSIDLAFTSNLEGILDPVRANRRLASWSKTFKKLIPIAWVTPGLVEPSEVERLLDLGFRGLKFHPTAGRYPADSNVLDPYLELCQARSAPALFHCASDRFSGASLFSSVAARFPSLKLILAHMNLGGPAEEAIAVAERYTNVYLDTSWATPDSVAEAIRRVGSSKVLYGTDAPLGGPGHYKMDKVRGFLEITLSPRDSSNIFYENAARLFHGF
ncbi:MAG: amidohydrolase family protein [Bacillota bacterium]